MLLDDADTKLMSQRTHKWYQSQVIKGVVQPIALTTAEQRLARKNELKARGTLLMALPDKHQLKFNIHEDAKTLMEAIEKSLKIYKAKVKSSFSASTSTQNIASVSSQNTDNTNEPVSDVASVKILVYALPNVDTLNADDLEEMDLKWKMAMLTVKARSLKDTRKNVAVKPQRRNVPVEISTSNALVSQCDGYNTSFMFDYDEMFSSETDESLHASPKYDRYHSRDGYYAIPPPCTGTFMPSKPNLVFHDTPNVNETVHTAFNVELSTTKLDKDLSHRPSAPIIEDWVSDSENDSKAELP
nr:hypothetical protein [Tanacetum cinerariifolium]